MPELLVGYSDDYHSPWYSGVATAALDVVPGTYPVAVNGHPYLLNTDPQAIESYGDLFKEESLPLLRQQADQGKQPGEQSLSPQQFWRRSPDTWHKGAGQSVLDRENSDPARFHTSKGVDPWTKYQLSLLPTTYFHHATATSGNMSLAGVGSYAYFGANDSATLWRSDLTNIVTCTGTPASFVYSMATNGSKLWVAYGTDGIYQVTGTTASSYVTGTITKLAYVKGRLLASNGHVVYNPVTGGTLPAPLYTHPDTSFIWTAFAEGNSWIYLGGLLGNDSWIYRVAVQPDGTALGVPVVAATLPNGEVVRSMIGYLGFIIVGTDKGVRFATADNNGDLTLGALIPTNLPVRCLIAGERFVWFGWSNYDTTSTGLGRLDLQTINDGLVPAYASDLMMSDGGQGTVSGVVRVNNRLVFCVNSVGLAVQSTGYVGAGTLTTGQITYGISDPKIAVQVDLKHAPLPEDTSIAVAITTDRAAAPTTIGSSAVPGSVSPAAPISAARRIGEEHELTLTLNSTLFSTSRPTLTRWTLLSYPAPQGTSVFVLPIVLAPRLQVRDGERPQNTYAEYLYLRGLHASQEIATVQVGDVTFNGVLTDFTWLPLQQTTDRSFWAGTFIAKFRRMSG